VLTPLQRHAAEVIAGLEAAHDFALAGGAALILQGAVDRPTRDLDFFTVDPSGVQRLLPQAEQALEEAGFSVRRVREGVGFVRLEVGRSDESFEIDLASDARLFPAETEAGLPVLNPTELAVDKVLAIFGRAEARDFVDLAALEEHHDLGDLFRLAAEKDRGFSIDVFADMLGRFDRLRAAEFGLDPPGYDRLRTTVEAIKGRSLDLARTFGQELGRERGREI
jgi:hypothetical protein